MLSPRIAAESLSPRLFSSVGSTQLLIIFIFLIFLFEFKNIILHFFQSNEIFLLGENEEDTEKLYGYLQEKYPDIVILGKDFLMGDEDDQVDKVINEINMWNPQAVLSCSRVDRKSVV